MQKNKVKSNRPRLSTDNLNLYSLPSFTLKDSYKHCWDIFKVHSKSYSFACKFLKEAQKNGIAAVYAFCRFADDLVDESGFPIPKLKKELNLLGNIIDDIAGDGEFDHPIFIALKDTIHRFEIPTVHFHDLIKGVSMDLEPINIQTIEELYIYSYRVASVVGVISCYVFKRTSQKVIDRAIDLGQAMQLTNILRDVGEDYKEGRIYIPQERRDEFGVTNEDFEQEEPPENLKNLIKSEIKRADEFFEKAEEGIDMLPPGAAFTVKLASKVYRAILRKIEEIKYSVLKTRAVVSKRVKYFIARKVQKEIKEKRNFHVELE